jgi:hypothetical protein
MKMVILPLLILMVAGCTSNSQEVSGPDPGNSKLTLELREVHLPTGQIGPPQPALILVTSEVYGCCNYEILTHIERHGDVLEVDVVGVNLPGGMCQTALGPAHARISLPELSECDRIIFRRGADMDQYSITVDDSTLRLRGPEGHFTQIVDTLVWRFPQKSMVYTCGTRTEDSCLCRQFRDSLLAHLDLQAIDVPVTGAWPYPKETIGYYYNMTPLVFRYASESEFQRAGELLKEFSRTKMSGLQGVGLALSNWRNEQHFSWLIRDSTISDH